MSFQVIDKKAILDDEHINRLKRIKLIERETAEQAPLWQQKKSNLVPTSSPIDTNPDPRTNYYRRDAKERV